MVGLTWFCVFRCLPDSPDHPHGVRDDVLGEGGGEEVEGAAPVVVTLDELPGDQRQPISTAPGKVNILY